VDTCGWLEFIAESANAKNFEKAILDTENLLVPAIVVYEVFKKVTLEVNEEVALKVMAELKQGKVVEINEAISIYAAKLSLEKKLPMADALIYAIGLMRNATILTQDNHFKGLTGVQYFEKA
jgi:PIN domain nuclease of toxin-antitoxin system